MDVALPGEAREDIAVRVGESGGAWWQAAVFAVVFSGTAAFADHTCPVSHAGGSATCGPGVCTADVVHITFNEDPIGCVGGCTVTYVTAYTLNACPYADPTVLSLKLLEVPYDPSDCSSGPEVADLLSGASFAMTEAQWQNMLAGTSYTVAGEIETEPAGPIELIRYAVMKTARATADCISQVPATSQWGMIVLAGLTLFAGALILRRRHRRCGAV